MEPSRHYWIYSPGEQANRWNEFREAGILALSYNEGAPNDLRSYGTEEDLIKSFQKAAGDGASHKNGVKALVDLRDVMKPGDLVFAKKGQKTIVGIGRVTGEYEFATDASDMRHRRPVEWFDVKERTIKNNAPLKTLTDITPYADFLVRLADACDIEDLYTESQFRMWDETLQKWPIDALRKMSISQYTMLGSKNCFCYYLETTLSQMGGISGGGRYIFGIFDPDRKNLKPLKLGAAEDDKYRWYTKYGDTADVAFETVRSLIVQIAEYASQANYGAIDDIDFSPAVKWKIAFLYQKRDSMGVVDIYKKEMMQQAVGIVDSNVPMSQLYAKAFSMMSSPGDVFAWVRRSWRKIGGVKSETDEMIENGTAKMTKDELVDKLIAIYTDSHIPVTAAGGIFAFTYGEYVVDVYKPTELMKAAHAKDSRVKKRYEAELGSALNMYRYFKTHPECFAAFTKKKQFGSILSTLPLDEQIAWAAPYLAAIRTKPFVLLAGISGTGKSRMVRELARGCCPEWKDDAKTQKHPLFNEQKPGNFEMIPVRPNWHDSSELMGYVSRINGKDEYQVTDFVKFLCKAWRYEQEGIPFFLCLDEMNLAPVEQYFAEYLSVVETRKHDADGKIVTDPLIRFKNETVLQQAVKESYASSGLTQNEIDNYVEQFKKAGGIPIPSNFVVMGTVNMDETTFSFSRKVLDRAMSFELNDVSDMYDPAKLAGEGDLDFGTIPTAAATTKFLTGKEAYNVDAGMGKKILGILEILNEQEVDAKNEDGTDEVGKTMPLLAKTPFKIAYRTRNEIMIYCLERCGGGSGGQGLTALPKALDEALSMKVLSRIEGDNLHVPKKWLVTLSATIDKELSALPGYDKDACKACREKLAEMAVQTDNGYTSFWTR